MNGRIEAARFIDVRFEERKSLSGCWEGQNMASFVLVPCRINESEISYEATNQYKII
jgi:hypothetical protein